MKSPDSFGIFLLFDILLCYVYSICEFYLLSGNMETTKKIPSWIPVLLVCCLVGGAPLYAYDFLYQVDVTDTTQPFGTSWYVADAEIAVQVDDALCDPGDFTVALLPGNLSAPDNTTPPAPLISTFINVAWLFTFVDLWVGNYTVFVQSNTSLICSGQLAVSNVAVGQLPPPPPPPPVPVTPTWWWARSSIMLDQWWTMEQETHNAAPVDPLLTWGVVDEEGSWTGEWTGLIATPQHADMLIFSGHESPLWSSWTMSTWWQITEENCRDYAWLRTYRDSIQEKKAIPAFVKLTLIQYFESALTVKETDLLVSELVCEIARLEQQDRTQKIASLGELLAGIRQYVLGYLSDV